FQLDLTELMAEHPDGLVRIELQVVRSNSIYECEDERPAVPVMPMPEDHDGLDYYARELEPGWYQQYYESSGYWNYSERNNPCHEDCNDYGHNASSHRTIEVSSSGILPKRGADTKLHVNPTGHKTAAPLRTACFQVVNFQLHLIGTASS